MPHGLLGGFGYVSIEATEEFAARRSDSVDASSPVAGVSLAHNESVALETRDKASQV
jgi:hypothetical protein